MYSNIILHFNQCEIRQKMILEISKKLIQGKFDKKEKTISKLYENPLKTFLQHLIKSISTELEEEFLDDIFFFKYN